MTILLQPYVLFMIGVNITSVIEKFFREPVSAQFDQLKIDYAEIRPFQPIRFHKFLRKF